MEVKIGIQSAPRELIVETDSEADDVEAAVKAAIADSGVLVVATAKGGRVLVPADKIAYLEFGDTAARRVGFSNL
ncbi:MAG TPA: DUF3107 domain-containing protein [Streptosporangiaceae bacterium]|nr:DUF3107 domain-containing protein [Streptosporangiaceae bacterium]